MLPGACIGDVSPTCRVCIVCIARMEIGSRDRPPAIPTIHFARCRDIGAIRVILKRELIKGHRMAGRLVDAAMPSGAPEPMEREKLGCARSVRLLLPPH